MDPTLPAPAVARQLVRDVEAVHLAITQLTNELRGASQQAHLELVAARLKKVADLAKQVVVPGPASVSMWTLRLALRDIVQSTQEPLPPTLEHWRWVCARMTRVLRNVVWFANRPGYLCLNDLGEDERPTRSDLDTVDTRATASQPQR